MTLGTSLIRYFERSKSNLTLEDLITYPQDTLGNQLGKFLFANSYEQEPIPERKDIYRLLITKEVSNTEEIAMYCYLFGNEDKSLQTIFSMVTGALFYPHCIQYFYKRYKDGKKALRFYDLDCFKMLHLPVTKIKDAFLIQ